METKSVFSKDKLGQDNDTERATPVRDRLYSDIISLNDQVCRSARAHDILKRHPEFEELIELLGLIRVSIRTAPLQSFRAAVIE